VKGVRPGQLLAQQDITHSLAEPFILGVLFGYQLVISTHLQGQAQGDGRAKHGRILGGLAGGVAAALVVPADKLVE
jgi:hypothetical protein